LFGPTAKIFKGLMDLTPSMVALLVAMPALSGSLLRIPFAASVENNGGRKPFLVLLGLSLLGMLGLTVLVLTKYPDGLSRSYYPLLLFFGLLCGCGIATFSVGVGQVAYWFPKKQQGKALGIFGGGGNLAPGIFSFLLPLVLGWLGMAGAYLVWLIFLVIGTVLYYFLGRNAPYFQFRAQGINREQAVAAAKTYGQEMFPSGMIKESLLISARTWKTWPLVAIYFTTFGGFMALTSWLPTYWKSFLAVPVVTAGLFTALYSILASLMRVVGGKIADRLGGERTILLALVVTLIGLLMMVISASVGLSLTAVIVLAVGMGVSNAAVFKLVPQEVPRAVGGASGWVGGLGAFGGFTLPPLLGAIVAGQGQPGYANGFLLFVLLGLLSFGLAVLLARTHTTEPKPMSTPQKSMEEQHAAGHPNAS